MAVVWVGSCSSASFPSLGTSICCKCGPKKIKQKTVVLGVPAGGQRDQWCLGSAGMQVLTPAGHSGLSIWHCCSFSSGCNSRSDLIPGPGELHVPWGGQKRKKKTKTKQWLLSFFFFFFDCACNMWKFLGQGLNASYSSDNTESLTTRPPGNS